MMKRIIAGMLVLAMSISLGACGKSTTGGSSDASNTASNGKKSPSDFKKFTIGIAEGQANDETVIRREYLEKYIAPKYNVKFIFSELLKDASAELSFIENCKDAGADAIIDYKIANTTQMAQVCQEAGMKYIFNSQNSGATADTYKVNPESFFGGMGADQPAAGKLYSDYLKKNASKDGSEGFLISSAIASSGNEQHMQLTAAALTALQELYGLTYQKSINDLVLVDAPTVVANNKGINIYIYPGSNTKDSWLPGISAVLQTGKYGFLISAGQSYTSSSVVVDEVERNFNKDIKVISIAALGSSLTTAFNTKDKFGNASINLASVKSVTVITGGLFALTYNALTGYGKNIKQADGTCGSYNFRLWGVESADKLAVMNNWDNKSTGKWIADYDFINSLLGIYNPDLTPEKFQNNVNDCSYENTLKKLGDGK